MPEVTPVTEKTQALYLAVQQLANDGTLLILLNVATILFGLVLAILVISDWTRRRWGNVLPAVVFGVGFATMVAGYILLGIVGVPIGYQFYQVAGDDVTQILLREGKQIGAPLAALAVVAMSSGAMYVSLGGAAIWKNRRQVREERRLVMEVARV